MTKYFFLLLCLTGIQESYAQNAFTVKAKINNPNNYVLFLGYLANGKFVADTSYTIENGWYVFKGSVNEPVVAVLGVRNNPELVIKTGKGFMPGPSLNFVLSNDEIKVEGDANEVYMASVQGGVANKEWEQIRTDQGILKKQMWLLQKERYTQLADKKDTVAVKRINDTLTILARKDFALQKKFIAGNPQSILSAYFLMGMINLSTIDELKSAFEPLNPEVKNSTYAKRIADKIKGMNATAVGKEAVPISKKDKDGKPVNLETLKGKYVLLDFWGSWCAPCRMSHPHLKSLYAKYKDKGFEILGIAQETRQTLEECRAEWLKAVIKDEINWLQVLNNEDADKFDAVKAYGVTAFPTKILLDKEGKVIGRYVGEGGNAFDDKLKEIFGF